MSDIIVPLISAVLVALGPSIFSIFQHRKSLYAENLNELYKHFISPIYYLLMSSYSTTYIISEIANICETKSYLIPDTFLENFSTFKAECKNTDMQNTEFFKQIVILNRFLRCELHYSKSNLNLDEKRIAKNYLGKHPSLFGVFLVSMGMGTLSLLLAMPVYFLYRFNIINNVWYYAIVCILFVAMSVLNFMAMDRYYYGKK